MHDVAVIRWCDHGEDVRAGESSHGCSGCVAGQCGAYLACEMPEPEPARGTPSRFAFTTERIAALAGAAVGLCAAGALAARFFS